MTIFWRYLDANEADVGASEPFADREDAEAWLGSSWAGLRERGIASVALVEDGAERYRMSLADAVP